MDGQGSSVCVPYCSPVQWKQQGMCATRPVNVVLVLQVAVWGVREVKDAVRAMEVQCIE